MYIEINTIGKILRNRLIPGRIRGFIIKYLSAKYDKKYFMVKTCLNGNNFFTGGVFGKTDNSELKIEKISIDEYVLQQNITDLDLIKIDVEGGELEVEVIEGSVNTIY